MATTASFTISKTDLTAIGTGAGSFIIQSQGPSPVVVHVAAAEPADNAPGVIIGEVNKVLTIAETDGTIYAKAGHGSVETQKVVVIASGVTA